MPDPLEYLLATLIAAGLSALSAWGLGWRRVPDRVACGPALAAGIAAGGYVLQLPVSFPPSNGLGRFFAVLLPMALGIEIAAGWTDGPRWLFGLLRLALTTAAGSILLHGSVYLSGDSREWSAAQAALLLAGGAGALAAVWALLLKLARRSGGVSVVSAIGLAIFCGGLTAALNGYLGGGEASLPVVGALAGYGVAIGVRRGTNCACEGAIGVGVVALFGLLFIGRFFGRVSSGAAIVLFFAPLVYWVSELPWVGRWPRWRIALLRLGIVALPLALVVALAKADFDRATLPLLS